MTAEDIQRRDVVVRKGGNWAEVGGRGEWKLGKGAELEK